MDNNAKLIKMNSRKIGIITIICFICGVLYSVISIYTSDNVNKIVSLIMGIFVSALFFILFSKRKIVWIEELLKDKRIDNKIEFGTAVSTVYWASDIISRPWIKESINIRVAFIEISVIVLVYLLMYLFLSEKVFKKIMLKILATRDWIKAFILHFK